MLKWITFGAMMLSVTSCASFLELLGFGFSEPKVEIRDVKVKNISFGDVSLEIGLRVHNPNDFELKIDKLTYVAFMREDSNIAQGELFNVLQVPPQGRQDIQLPLKINAGAAMQIVAGALSDQGAQQVNLIADVVFDTPVGQMSRQFKMKRGFQTPKE